MSKDVGAFTNGITLELWKVLTLIILEATSPGPPDT